MKKAYEKPVVKHTEEIEARAVQCNKTSAATCSQMGQPVTS